MHWEIKDNVISSLYYEGEDLIFPWGVETADSSAFYSQEDGVGYRYRSLSGEGEHSSKHFRMCERVKMCEGQFCLTCDDAIVSENQLIRTAKIECIEDSFFMDFVMRFRFRKSHFPSVMIAGKRLEHCNTNIYYQYPVRDVILEGKKQVHIAVHAALMPGKMAPFLYARDCGDEWVVHARMLPQRSDKEVIKLCNRWAKTRPLPDWMSRPLLAVPSVREALLYRGERKPFTGPLMRRINPQVCPLVKMAKGESLLWRVGVTLC